MKEEVGTKGTGERTTGLERGSERWASVDENAWLQTRVLPTCLSARGFLSAASWALTPGPAPLPWPRAGCVLLREDVAVAGRRVCACVCAACAFCCCTLSWASISFTCQKSLRFIFYFKRCHFTSHPTEVLYALCQVQHYQKWSSEIPKRAAIKKQLSWGWRGKHHEPGPSSLTIFLILPGHMKRVITSAKIRQYHSLGKRKSKLYGRALLERHFPLLQDYTNEGEKHKVISWNGFSTVQFGTKGGTGENHLSGDQQWPGQTDQVNHWDALRVLKQKHVFNGKKKSYLRTITVLTRKPITSYN